MIDFVRGRLAARELEYIVVDVNGVGYRVWCPNPFDARLREQEDVTMHTHYHVREDAHLLFGFPTQEEKYLFRRLLDVTGIGPKVALGMLSGARPEAIIAAIQSENIAYLTKLPGVGKKTAQRIVLDLKDKLSAASGGSVLDGAVLLGAAALAPEPSLAAGGPWGEAKEALLALGFGEGEVDRGLAAIRGQLAETAPSVDVVVRHALQALYKA